MSELEPLESGDVPLDVEFDPVDGASDEALIAAEDPSQTIVSLDALLRPWTDEASPEDQPDPELVREVRTALLADRAALVACDDEPTLRAVVRDLQFPRCFELSGGSLDAGAAEATEALVLSDSRAAAARLVVLWATSPRERPFIDGFWGSGSSFAGILDALARTNLHLVILTREAWLPARERAWWADRRALARHPSHEVGGSPVRPLGDLLCDLFDTTNLERVLAGYANDINLVGARRTVAHRAAEVLHQHGTINQTFFEMLRHERPDQAERIRACASQMPWNQAARAREQELLEARIELRPARPSVRVCCVDATDTMLATRLDRGERQTFEEQRTAGWWGANEREVITEVRAAVERGELMLELDARGNTEKMLPEGLENPTPVQLVTLFVLAFLRRLQPTDLHAIIEGLLELEERHLRELGTPSELLRMWRLDTDAVLRGCRIEVREVREGAHTALRATWQRSVDGRLWRRILTQSRHFFVERQLAHLQDARFLGIGSDGDDGPFSQIVELLVERRSLAGGQQAPSWTQTLGALGSEPPPRRIVRRLATMLAALQESDALRGQVRPFLDSLIRSQRACAFPLIIALAGRPKFPEMEILGEHAHSHGVQQRVRDTTVRLCLSTNAEQQQRACEAVDRWLDEPAGPRRNLGLATVLRLVSRTLAQEDAAGPFAWTSLEPPAYARWIIDPRTRATLVGSTQPQAWLDRVLRPPGTAPDTLLALAYERYDRAAGPDGRRTFTTLLASALVVWTLRLGRRTGDTNASANAIAAVPEPADTPGLLATFSAMEAGVRAAWLEIEAGVDLHLGYYPTVLDAIRALRASLIGKQP